MIQRMIKKFLYKVSGRLPIRFINREGERYLERYYVGQFLGRTIYLHRFVDSDGDKEVHDHPWDSFSFMLAGCYVEERMIGLCPEKNWLSVDRICTPWKFNQILMNDFHRITVVVPETWTLFVHKTKRVKSWGFLKANEDGSTLYHQPINVKANKGWYKKNVTLGKDSDRLPFIDDGE